MTFSEIIHCWPIRLVLSILLYFSFSQETQDDSSFLGICFIFKMCLFFPIQLFYNDGGEHGDEVLYGTTDGKIGFVHLTRYIETKHGKLRNGQHSVP